MKDHIAVVGSGGGIGEALVGSLVSTSAEVLFLDTDQRAVDRAAALDRRRREQEATDASNRAVEASRRAETVAGTERTERRVRAGHRFDGSDRGGGSDENERGGEQ